MYPPPVSLGLLPYEQRAEPVGDTPPLPLRQEEGPLVELRSEEYHHGELPPEADGLEVERGLLPWPDFSLVAEEGALRRQPH